MRKSKAVTKKASRTVAKKATVVPVKKKIGRPTMYSQKLAEDICARLSGGESLLSICKGEKMPQMRVVFNWLASPEKKDFLKAYELAREQWADAVFEKTLEIAEHSLTVARVGKVAIASARVHAVKLHVDTLKWALGRMSPKKYGDKLDLTTKGKEFKQPRPATINYVVPSAPAAV